jgi:galactokinase
MPKVAERYQDLFGRRPRVFRAPGRANLIGEHTDYNQGFVLPCAINLETRVAAGPCQPDVVAVYSESFDQQETFDLQNLGAPRGDWADYIRGVAQMLQNANCGICGMNMIIESEVPIGSGLSSSAALEVASALAMLAISNLSLNPLEIAKICQQAENEYVGARSGIMDQFACCFGKKGHAILLDCRSLHSEYVPIPETVRLVVSNTMVRHTNAGGEYNRRREQCEEGVRILSTLFPHITSLRDATLDDLRSARNKMDEVIFRRCLHVVEENARVLKAIDALAAGALDQFGDLMRASHESLRVNYEVSSPELDLMVRLASCVPGVYGSRMMGGGFGGCTISLVDSTRTNTFVHTVSEAYLRETGKRPEIYVCSAEDGASEVAAA